MKKKIIYLMVPLVALILIVYVSNITAVNVSNQESVIKGIVRYQETSVKQIIMTKFDEDEYFILYNDLDDDLHLCIFEKTRFSFDRYYFASAGSSGGVLGEFIFSEGTGSGYRQLSVAYGSTSSLTEGTFKVMMKNETITVKPSEEFFLEIFREESQDAGMITIDFR